LQFTANLLKLVSIVHKPVLQKFELPPNLKVEYHGQYRSKISEHSIWSTDKSSRSLARSSPRAVFELSKFFMFKLF
jgi:hypothetical protein